MPGPLNTIHHTLQCSFMQHGHCEKMWQHIWKSHQVANVAFSCNLILTWFVEQESMKFLEKHSNTKCPNCQVGCLSESRAFLMPPSVFPTVTTVIHWTEDVGMWHAASAKQPFWAKTQKGKWEHLCQLLLEWLSFQISREICMSHSPELGLAWLAARGKRGRLPQKQNNHCCVHVNWRAFVDLHQSELDASQQVSVLPFFST